jgi:hypothetical protein
MSSFYKGGHMIEIKNLYNLGSSEWPEDAAALLLNTLNDPDADPSDRLQAAEMAGDLVVINDPMAEALLTLLKNQNEADALRGKAATALGPALEHGALFEFEDPDDIVLSEPVFRKVQQSLQHIFQDKDVPKDVRRKALEASVRAPLAWHPKAVEAAFKVDDDDWRLTAVFCMRYIMGFDALILDALESSHPGIRYQAVLAAGSWGVKKAWPHIANLLDPKSEDEPLLLAAVQAASGLDLPQAATALKGLLGSGNNTLVDAVNEALAMMGPGLSDGGLNQDDSW